MRTTLLLIMALVCTLMAAGQGKPLHRIMVIPFTKEGEDIRTVLDNNVNLRIAATMLKDRFDEKGYTTVDFAGRLKAAHDERIFTSDNEADIKSRLIELSGCDIYVVVDVDAHRDVHSGSASVNAILTAYDVSTGNSLANKVGSSGKFITSDMGKLTARAVNECADGFVDMMSRKFREMEVTGKSLFVDFSFADGSAANMTTPIAQYNKMPLSELLENWLSKNALNNGYHIQGVTKLRLIADEVHVPVMKSDGKVYSTNEFATELCKFIGTTGLQARKEVKASTIYITIN